MSAARLGRVRIERGNSVGKCWCKAKMVKRTYRLKTGRNHYRELTHCSEKVLHTYSPETLSEIDVEALVG